MAKIDMSQEELLELIRQGKTQNEIATILGVSQTTINKKIKKIDETILEEAKYEAKQKEQKEILELIRQGKTQKEIATILGVSYSTLSRKIGEIDETILEEAKYEAKQKEQEELLELIRQGKTKLEIVRIQKRGYDTINRIIHKIDETLLEKAMQEGEAKREETLQKEEKQILELTKEGKTQNEIAKAMDVKQTDISMRIKEIDKVLVDEAIQEAIEKGLRSIASRTIEIKEEILELIRQGKTQKEIATILGVSYSTLNKKIAKIDETILEEARQEGKEKREQIKQEAKKEEILKGQEVANKKEQEDILELIRQGKTKLEIVRIQKIGYEALNRRIHKIDETLLEKAMQEGEAKRGETLQKEEEQILELIKQGKMQDEIAEAMDVKQTDISMRIKEIDKVLVDKAKQEVKREAKQKEQDEILELIRQGKTNKEIQDILGIPQSTFYLKIAKIDETVLEAAKQKGKEKREQIKQEAKENEEKENKEEQETANKKEQVDILELIRQGKIRKEIAQILGVSNSAITKRIDKIDPKLVLEAEIEGEIKRQGVEGQEEAIKQIREKFEETFIQKEMKKANTETRMNAKTIREKIDKKEITVDDVKEYRAIIDDKYDKVTYEEIILLVNAYIKTRQTSEAIQFLNTVINNEDLRYLDVEKMKNVKTKIEQIKKRQTARRLLRQDKRISYIMAQTGLKETEVLAIKREVEKQLGIGI